jgi:low temperature requirement protein LtrA
MAGRDPHEAQRVATPLELLFDLTFATSFGLAAAQFAHSLGEAQYTNGLFGFAFAALAICWAWVNFSWFSSAYDTDDWVFRIATMVQMAGVLILAIGLPRMFASLEHAVHLDVSVMVLGYVVMRMAMVFQWLRAARQDPARRRACLTYAGTIVVAQLGWIGLILIDKTPLQGAVITTVLWAIEFAGPALAEHKDGGTPWHAHHIAERYSLFAIIALGEGVVGTVAAISAVIERQGWSLDAGLVCAAGTGLTFGVWWVYYQLPSARILHSQRRLAFVWGYTQMMIVSSIVAIGAGLHLAALYLEGHTRAGPLATVMSVATPVGLFLVLVRGLGAYLEHLYSRTQAASLVAAGVALSAAVVAAYLGADMAWCLLGIACAPAFAVIGYELGAVTKTEENTKL